MKVIGITGGTGSGKSYVLAYLEKEYGAHICELDKVAKDLQEKGQKCYYDIVAYFGKDILNEDESINRQALADIVFNDSNKLDVLNGLVHPSVKEFVIKDMEIQKEKGTKIYVIESALMPTAGYENICEDMWYIYTDENVRRQRLKASRGYSDKKMDEMFSSQAEDKDFRKISNRVIDNSGDFENTKKQIGEIL